LGSDKEIMAAAGKRVLIINGDDLGYARGVNETMMECCAAGLLRSCTLMANGTAFDHAVDLAVKTKNLDVGVHLVLTELPPVSSPDKLPGLIDDRGHLPATPAKLMAALLQGKINRKAIRQELASQITKILDHGLHPTHLDSHKHVHVLPQVLEVVIDLARSYSISWVRTPFDATPFFPFVRVVDQDKTLTFCIQHLKGQLLRGYRKSFSCQIEASGMRTPDHFFGVSLTGAWNEEAMIGLMEALPPGVTEWMLHPGTCDEDLVRSGTRLRDQREVERALLLAPQMQEHLARKGITLSSFRAEVA
jgi:chitin disaccharide deacetylase